MRSSSCSENVYISALGLEPWACRAFVTGLNATIRSRTVRVKKDERDAWNRRTDASAYRLA